MGKELIGTVAVDSGQLMICDPCYISNEWQDVPFRDVRAYKNASTGKILTYGKDFISYAEVIKPYKNSMNKLIASGTWVEQEPKRAPISFSYDGACQRSLSKQGGYGNLPFKAGHYGAGFAIRTMYGDGSYPIYAKKDKDGCVTQIIIDL